ncbi:MAG: hypothetical protein J3K34DRAFT_430311 [Monoraphidium minutum]|nr:MAG: hypothetical protein J3K34DRAFT_430311 [Monoraphidium minutum]
MAAARRGKVQVSEAAVADGILQLEGLIPGFQISCEVMKTAEWLKLVRDPAAAAVKLVALKRLYPTADLSRIIRERPSLLLQEVDALEDAGRQVQRLLESARDRDALLSALPFLLDPRTLVSVLITVDKWYFGARDPVEVLESDPEMLIRAMTCDVPLEPVFDNPDGSLMVPSFNYKEKKADWQAHIDKTQPRLHWGSSGVESML